MLRYLLLALALTLGQPAHALSPVQVAVVTPAYQAPGETGWTPATVSTAYWKVSDHGTANMTDDGSGLISSWKDALLAIDATGATTARPTWSTTGFFGTAPGVGFDGTANALTATAGISGLPNGATAGEIWVSVDYQRALGSFEGIVGYGGAGVTYRMVARDRVSTISRANLNDAATSTNDASVVFFGPHVVQGAWSGTSQTGRIDGAPISNSGTIATINTGTTRFRLGAYASGAGASLFCLCAVSEVAVTPALSLANQQRMEAYLLWTVGRPWQLPWNHPYRNRRP